MSSPVIEREYQKGKIIFASPESLRPILLDVTKIASWGSKAVSCCVVANGLDKNQVGVARRSVLSTNAGKNAHLVVSETLVALRNSPLKTFVTFSLTEPMLQRKVSHSDTLKDEQAELLKRASVSQNSSLSPPRRLNEENSNQEQQKEKSRPPNPSDAVPSALYMDTTLSLCPVDSDPEKSFVEIFVEYAAADATKAEEIGFFLEKNWVGPLLESLADYALNISFPVQQGRTDVQFRKLYERHEETVVRICAKKHIDDELKDRSEALLDALYGSYRDTLASQSQTENMKNELYSTQILLREATSKIAELESELNTVQGKLLIAEHAGTNNNNNNTGDEEDQQQPSHQTPLTQAIQAVPQQNSAQTATESQQQLTQQTQTPVGQQQQNNNNTSSSSAAVTLRGGLASDKAAFTATPEQRSRQVISAIPDFGVSSSGNNNNNNNNASLYKIFNSPLLLGGQKGREASEAALRAKFQALDVDRQGYLTVDNVCQLLAVIDPSDEFDVKQRLERERQVVTPRRRGAAANSVKAELENPSSRSLKEMMHYREAMDWCVKNCRDKSGKRVTFDEFAVLMCQLERAI